ncbi:MAG: hypothetical protein PHO70_01405, partial [Candidatus Omnitrophica bacterium]|nr:hypothetical protein [Candidatus Omnitrophota bacterium]
TKEGQAEGKARLEDKKGEIEGEKISYNFENKTGIILDAAFRANPYFGKSESRKFRSRIRKYRNFRMKPVPCKANWKLLRLIMKMLKKRLKMQKPKLLNCRKRFPGGRSG